MKWPCIVIAKLIFLFFNNDFCWVCSRMKHKKLKFKKYNNYFYSDNFKVCFKNSFLHSGLELIQSHDNILQVV